MSLFTEEGRKRIESAVADAESRTSGEIVVAVVPASSNYADLRWIAASAALAVTTAFLLWLRNVSLFRLVEWQMVASVFASFVPVIPGIGRRLVSKHRLFSRVRREAFARFAQLDVGNTANHNGILILISEWERSVHILPDRAALALAPAEFWKEAAGNLGVGLNSPDPSAAACRTIAKMGELLASRFPPDGKTKRLPNQVQSQSNDE